jgi:hypothetical protein
VASCASAEVAVSDLPRPPLTPPIAAAAAAGVPLAGGGVAGWVLTTITGGMAGLAASAGVVVVVVVSVAAASSWLFLSPDDCFAESSAGPDPWTWPGSAACAGAIGFAACGCEAELGLAGFWALAVVPSCAEGLLLLEGGGAVVLGFAGGWLFWPCDVCAGAVLLPSVAAAVDFELLFDWKLLLCCRGEPPVDIGAAGGDGFACAPICCWEDAASSKAVNGWESVCCGVGTADGRCCDADCANDDVELTSDAILGTARSLKAKGHRSACNRRASRRSPSNPRKFNMLGECAACGAVFVPGAIGKFCRPPGRKRTCAEVADEGLGAYNINRNDGGAAGREESIGLC